MTIKTKKSGFTIAEALMALLVISLITIASIPVITKKKRVIGTAVHGKWACTLNAQGQHIVFGSEQNPYGWTVSGNQCYFNPPRDARNFAVSAVGAGGGGAGSSMASEYHKGPKSINVTKYGKYRFYAIGGGGQGGGWNCWQAFSDSNEWGWGGATGGSGTGEIDIGSDVSVISIEVGSGGSGGSMNGAAGGDSVITAYNGPSSKEIIRARGGAGGPERQRSVGGNGTCDSNWTAPSAGSVTFGSGVTAKKSTPGNYSSSNGNKNNPSAVGLVQTLDPIGKMFDIEFNDLRTGGGGSPVNCSGSNTCPGNPGGGGAAGLIIETRFIGEGGKTSPSDVKRREFYPSLERISIVIGEGGAGGAAGTAGSKGGTTYFGDIFSLEGGEGGKVKNLETSNSTNKYAGENGETGKLSLKDVTKTTALGGMASGNTSSANGQNAKFYGSGGGGAGLNGSTSGKGGNGAPGYVLIEW